jgi:hypothetical protein
MSKIKTGDRVELLDMFRNAPFQGHTGTVMRKTKFMHLWKVRLDMPGLMGQTLAKVPASGLRKIMPKPVGHRQTAHPDDGPVYIES